MAVKLLDDKLMPEVLGMAFVITEPCMDVMDQACIRVCPVACMHCDAGKDRKLYIDPGACIDCGISTNPPHGCKALPPGPLQIGEG